MLEPSNLEKRLKDVANIDKLSELIMQSLKKLLEKERYEAETRVTQRILEAGLPYEDFILSWEAYVVRAKSHLAAGIDSKEAKSDRRVLTARTKQINVNKADQEEIYMF